MRGEKVNKGINQPLKVLVGNSDFCERSRLTAEDQIPAIVPLTNNYSSPQSENWRLIYSLQHDLLYSEQVVVTGALFPLNS